MSQGLHARDLIESAPDALLVSDAAGRIILVNGQAEVLFGYGRDELLGQPVELLIPKRIRERHIRHRLTFLRNPRLRPMGIAMELLGLRKDGTEFPVEVSLSPVKVAGGVAVASAIRDLTDARRLMRQLQRTTRALRATSQCNQIVARASDEREMLDEVCRTLTATAGYALAWVGIAEHDAARSVRVVGSAGKCRAYLEGLQVTWSDSELGRGPTGTAIRTGKPALINIRDDSAFAPWRSAALKYGFACSIALPLQVEGQILGALMLYSSKPDAFDLEEQDLLSELASDVAYGITALRARIQVHRTEERYQQLFERNPAGVYRSHVDGRILECNKAFVRMFGYASRDQLLARPASVLYKDMDDRRRMLERLLRERQIVNEEVEGVRADGTPVWFLESAIIVEDDVLEGTLVDVTELRRVESQLRQAQRLESIGRLAAGVAHDFNNILAAISAFGEVAKRQIASDHPAQGRLAEILKATRRGADLTRQLLAFGRRQELNPKILNLNEVLAGMHGMLQRLLGEDVVLILRLAPALGAIKADASQIEQVIMNLAINARDAMPNGGSLAFETANVDSGADDLISRQIGICSGPHVMLAASDTGFGMDEETRSRIFEPFFTTKAEGRGTGLGLATVYGIVKQSDGFIAVNSELGHGATFRIYLPQVDAPAPEDTAGVEEPEAASGTETILLVEDRHDLRQGMTEMLEGMGYTVLPAGTAEYAVALAHDYPDTIHLLITDVVIPGMNGRLVADRVTALRPDMRTLFMSGYADTVFEGGLRQAVHWLQKPFSASALGRAVRDALA